jgi:hypothetical protein
MERFRSPTRRLLTLSSKKVQQECRKHFRINRGAKSKPARVEADNMAERKVKLKLRGEDVDTWEIPFETTERWTEIRLEDGAILRLKAVVSNVYRVDGKTDNLGNPIYVVKSTNAMVTEVGPTRMPTDQKVN